MCSVDQRKPCICVSGHECHELLKNGGVKIPNCHRMLSLEQHLGFFLGLLVRFGLLQELGCAFKVQMGEGVIITVGEMALPCNDHIGMRAERSSAADVTEEFCQVSLVHLGWTGQLGAQFMVNGCGCGWKGLSEHWRRFNECS